MTENYKVLVKMDKDLSTVWLALTETPVSWIISHKVVFASGLFSVSFCQGIERDFLF